MIVGSVSIHEATKVDGLFSCGAHHAVGAFVLQGGIE